MRTSIVKKQILLKMINSDKPIRAASIIASNQNVYLLQLEQSGLISRRWRDEVKKDHKIAYFKDDAQRAKAVRWLKAVGVEIKEQGGQNERNSKI